MNDQAAEPVVKPRKKPGPKPGTKRPKPRSVSSGPENEQIASKQEAGLSREAAAHTPDRPKRIRMGALSKLAIPFAIDEVKFFHYYFLEEKVHQAQQAYYEQVQNPDTGVVHKVQFKNETLVLMRLPMQYRKEDLQEKRKSVINTLQDEKSGGVGEKNTAAPEYSGIEGRTGAIQVDGGFDPNSPYS